MLQEQVESLEVDVSDIRADLAHLSAQYPQPQGCKRLVLQLPLSSLLAYCSTPQGSNCWSSSQA